MDDGDRHDRDSTLSITGRPPPLRGSFAAGDRVDRYELVRQRGSGGMGVVWEARDIELDRRVAIKLVRSVATADGQHRLLREAQAMAKLSHPGVVPVFDVGTTDDQLFIVMELVDGETLGTRLRDRQWTWREIAAMFLACGRGLAAAHAAGIVHRDFKPDNVLVAADGRVRITDFGLARIGPPGESIPPLAAGSGSESSTLPGDVGDEALTGAGAVLGTPRYMAPEQRRGEPASPRADQFSFCVALWEALFGAPPAQPPAALVPPAKTEVPVAVQRLVARGLAADPAARWPSLAALLDALDARLRRTRLALIGAAVAVAAAAAVAVIVLRPGAAVDRCAGFDRDLTGVWDPPARAGVDHALAALPDQTSRNVATRVLPLLDGRARSWVAARAEVCRAAARKEVAPDVAQVRIACLDTARDELRAIAHLLASADAAVAGKAMAAAEDTARVDGCRRIVSVGSGPADTGAGSSAGSAIGAPGDPALAALRARVAEAILLRRLGRIAEAIAELPNAADAAIQAGQPALAARALLELAIAQTGGAKPDDAAATLQRVLQLAGAARDDRLLARALIHSIYVVGYAQEHHDQGLAQAPLAEAAVARAGSDPELVYSLRQNVGLVLALTDRPDEAQKSLDEALAILEASPDPNLTSMLSTLNALGNLAFDRGDYDRSRTMYERAITTIEQRDGKDAPLVAYPTLNLGNIASEQGRYADALALYQSAYDGFSRTLAPDSPTIAVAVMNVGMALDELERDDEARPWLERALAMREKALGPDHPQVASSLVNLVSLDGRTGRTADARAEIARAVAIRRKAYGPDHLLLATALTQQAQVEIDAGSPRAGLAPATEALAIFDRTGRRDHALVIEPLLTLGQIQLALHHPREAQAPLDRAVALAAAPAYQIGEAQFLLAEALWAKPAERDHARTLANDGLAKLVAAGASGKRWAARATAWLASHGAK